MDRGLRVGGGIRLRMLGVPGGWGDGCWVAADRGGWGRRWLGGG